VVDAGEGVRLAEERYAVGAGTINDLLDAQTALARADAHLIGAQWDYHIASAEFQRAVGGLVGEGQSSST
jgi:outer membrane protein TolC